MSGSHICCVCRKVNDQTSRATFPSAALFFVAASVILSLLFLRLNKIIGKTALRHPRVASRRAKTSSPASCLSGGGPERKVWEIKRVAVADDNWSPADFCIVVITIGRRNHSRRWALRINHTSTILHRTPHTYKEGQGASQSSSYPNT